MIEISCATPADTRAVGRRLAALLRAGDVLLLKGDLGAGKTVFAGGVAEGLGVEEPVTSPTFILARRYVGFLPVIHADVYRVGSSAEIEDLDLLEEEAVVMVEWGGVAEQQFGEDVLIVELTALPDESRILRLVPRGAWQDRPLGEVVV